MYSPVNFVKFLRTLFTKYLLTNTSVDLFLTLRSPEIQTFSAFLEVVKQLSAGAYAKKSSAWYSYQQLFLEFHKF